MCGIVGYVGKEECADILVEALRRLEYRGYDSAGIAVFEGDRIKTVKAKGKICPEEGYFITDVQFDFIGTTADGYVSALSLEDAAVSEVNAMVSATKKGSSAERVKAIDKFYESQSEGHRLLLSDLCRKVLSLDKKNETGLVSKYIVALSHADAYTYLVTGDVEKVLSIYEKNAADKRISPDDAQTLYYIGHILA